MGCETPNLSAPQNDHTASGALLPEDEMALLQCVSHPEVPANELAESGKVSQLLAELRLMNPATLTRQQASQVTCGLSMIRALGDRLTQATDKELAMEIALSLLRAANPELEECLDPVRAAIDLLRQFPRPEHSEALRAILSMLTLERAWNEWKPFDGPRFDAAARALARSGNVDDVRFLASLLNKNPSADTFLVDALGQTRGDEARSAASQVLWSMLENPETQDAFRVTMALAYVADSATLNRAADELIAFVDETPTRSMDTMMLFLRPIRLRFTKWQDAEAQALLAKIAREARSPHIRDRAARELQP